MSDRPYRVKPGSKVKLKDRSTDDTCDFREKSDVKPVVEKLLKKLDELQNLLYASSKHSLLIVLQAMDAGGKDGAIRHVFSGVNPQGCNVTSFKVPPHLELSHDYLWRYHMACPARGMIGIFNRSHYESVLVERVRNIVAEGRLVKAIRSDQRISKACCAENTVILKFFLHISKDEQKRRLEARLDDPDEELEIQSRRPGRTKVLGRLPSVRGSASAMFDGRRSVVYRSVRPQMVPQLGVSDTIVRAWRI